MYNHILLIIIILLVSYYFNTQKNINNIKKEHFQPKSKSKSKSCIKNINVSNKLKAHLDYINTPIFNKNIQQHCTPIPFNYSNKLEYSVMNNNGIKDHIKRQDYQKNNINNGSIIPYNKQVLLKNLNRNVFEHNYKDFIPPITNFIINTDETINVLLSQGTLKWYAGYERWKQQGHEGSMEDFKQSSNEWWDSDEGQAYAKANDFKHRIKERGTTTDETTINVS